MPHIRIKSPKTDRELSSDGAWYASGIADPGIRSVTGQVLKGKIPVAVGKTIHFTPRQKKDGTPPKARWVIRFCTPLVADHYYLEVAGDIGEPEQRRIAIVNGRAALLAVSITSHADNDNITAEADAFVAWGTLMNHSITSVTMERTNGPTIAADFIYEDWETSFWSAQFPVLGSGTYKLTVLDDFPHDDFRTGLTIN